MYGHRRGRSLRRGRLALPALATVCLVFAAEPLAAQAPAGPGAEPATAIRVTERYDPDTGRSDHAPVRPLNPAEVAAIQARLGQAGQPTALTGRLDEPTAAALRRFQEARDLRICGCPSYETLITLGLPTRTVQILVRSGPADEAAIPSGPEGGDVEIVYGTPPRPPAAAEEPKAPPGSERGRPGDADADPIRSEGARPYGFERHDHLLFPFFVGPGALFPPPPAASPSPQPRGLPFGRRPAGASSEGISTRRGPPPGTRSPGR